MWNHSARYVALHSSPDGWFTARLHCPPKRVIASVQFVNTMRESRRKPQPTNTTREAGSRSPPLRETRAVDAQHRRLFSYGVTIRRSARLYGDPEKRSDHQAERSAQGPQDGRRMEG